MEKGPRAKKLKELKAKLAKEKARQEALKKRIAELKKPLVKYKTGDPKPLKIPRYQRTDPPKKIWLYTLGTISAVSLFSGIYLLSIDSDLTCDGGYTEECRERFATATAGWAFTLTGLLVGGITGYLFYNVYYKEEPKVLVTPAVDKKSAGLNLTIRF